jgi:hypothetical protein
MLSPEMLEKIRALGLDPDKVMPVIDLISAGLAERIGRVAAGSNGKADPSMADKVEVTRRTEHGDKYKDYLTPAQIMQTLSDNIADLTVVLEEYIEMETEEEEDEDESFATD